MGTGEARDVHEADIPFRTRRCAGDAHLDRFRHRTWATRAVDLLDLGGRESALSPAPVEGITLAEKPEVTRVLLLRRHHP